MWSRAWTEVQPGCLIEDATIGNDSSKKVGHGSLRIKVVQRFTSACETRCVFAKSALRR